MRTGESTVLVVDEAQSLPLELLEEIRLLANIETHDEKLLSVILAGQPELADRLNERSLRQLKQRVALRCQLSPLTLQETCAYVAGRIRAAGGVGAQTFTREAVTLMHERAHGIPRTLNVIADNALVTAFATDRRPVNTKVVLEVCRDLDLQGSRRDDPCAGSSDGGGRGAGASGSRSADHDGLRRGAERQRPPRCATRTRGHGLGTSEASSRCSERRGQGEPNESS